MNIQTSAKDYANRVCNGTFPIEYTKEQVLKHTEGDFIAGANAFKEWALSILQRNYEACKTLVPEDAARPAQEIINETYEDLIAIIQKS